MGAVPTTKLNEHHTPCYHCGEPCLSDSWQSEQKSFCCMGCKTVYRLLQDHQLGSFYQLQQHAGSSRQNTPDISYDWLEDPQVQQRLIHYADDKQMRIHLQLPQIHCISCVWLLEHLHRLHPGVLSCRVNFLRRQAHICIDRQQLGLPDLLRLLDKIGYPPQLQFNDLDQPTTPRPSRKPIYQLGIAGFAFGNIMLLSFPDYLGIELIGGGGLPMLLGYLSIILILPVLFYSAQDYWRSAYFGLRQKRLSIDVPITLGMTVLFGRSVFEICTQSGTGYLDSLAGLIFFLLIGKWFQQKTFHRLSFERDYRSYFPIAVQRIEGHTERSVSLDKLTIGDRLIIRHGELIPADAILREGAACIDYSFVTGEAEPVLIRPGQQVYAGGRQVGAAIHIQLTKVAEQSYLTDLWNEASFSREAPAEELVQRVSPWFTLSILFLAMLTFGYWWPSDPVLAINAGTAVLIIACPCALALATPFVFGNVIRLLSRQHIYLKNTSVVERLATIDTLVFDKTGTLTHHKDNQLTYHGEALSEAEQACLAALAQHSSHPVSKNIVQKFSPTNKLPVTDFKELTGSGLWATVSGRILRLGTYSFVTAANGVEPDRPGTYVSIDGQVKGYFRISGAYRSGLARLFADPLLPRQRYVLSGDDDRDRPYLSTLFAADHLYFRQRPHDKLAFIRSLQKDGSRVLMLGDGLNDAGALRQSEVGVVISENTNNFTPASDVILSADRLTCLSRLLRTARQSVYLVYACFGLAFVYNLIGLSYAMSGQLTPLVAAILMPLSSITIVILGMVGSSLIAQKTS